MGGNLMKIKLFENGVINSGLRYPEFNGSPGTRDCSHHPRIDRIQYSQRLNTAAEAFNPLLCADEDCLNIRTTELIVQLNELGLGGLLKSGAYPIVIPTINVGSYTLFLFKELVPALANSLFRHFKNSAIWSNGFTQEEYWQAIISQHLSCQGKHVEVVNSAKNGPKYGIFFPFALRGYSISAAQKIVDGLPEGFSLAGPLDTIVPMLIYTDFLVSNPPRPHILTAGVSWGNRPDLTITIGSQMVGDQRELHCGISPPNLHDTGHPDFSAGLLFTL
jgi:hypothetical protein